jgi:hypothetical protein
MRTGDAAGSSLDALRRRGPAPMFGDVGVGDTFLVVVEGKVTERLYVQGVCGCLALGAVHVRVVRPTKHDPVGLVEAAIQERAGPQRRRVEGQASIREPQMYDHIWVVFDTDASGQAGRVKQAMELAGRENIHAAFSTPSIEFWLLLHFRYTTGLLMDSAAAERAVGDAWGQRYDKRADTFPKLWPALKPNIPAAVSRAQQVREYHDKGSTPFPANPSTQVDLLVRALDASVQPPRRILRLAGKERP